MSRNAQTYCVLRSPCMRPRAPTAACIACIVGRTRRATPRKIFHRVHARPSRTTHVRNPARVQMSEHWMRVRSLPPIRLPHRRASSGIDVRAAASPSTDRPTHSCPRPNCRRRGIVTPRSCLAGASAPKKMAALRAAIGCRRQRNRISARRLRAAPHSRPGPAGR